MGQFRQLFDLDNIFIKLSHLTWYVAHLLQQDIELFVLWLLYDQVLDLHKSLWRW